MRILLAVDGSVSSDRATELASSLTLPADSSVRIVSVQQSYVDILSMSWAAVGETATDTGETQEAIETRHRHEVVERAEQLLRRPGLTLEGFVLHGRPASSIVDEATAMQADLIIVGSRGHGTIATMLLGSTASEVVDHAPCPVLVARGESLGPIAFANDGSPSAKGAEALLVSWPMFTHRSISVVTVAEVAVPVAAGFTPGLYDQVLASYAESADDAREEVRQEATTAAERLAGAGLDTRPVALEGDAAAELVRFASERSIGTIVMGTRGHTGLTRLILGSVARNVLLHAPCSVLIVREPKHT